MRKNKGQFQKGHKINLGRFGPKPRKYPAKKESICLTCNIKFLFYPTATQGKYCSYKCYWKDKKVNEFSDKYRGDSKYHKWVEKVKKRDNNICRINDEYCKGYNIVHHIFLWAKYPELRYELTNGITLCQAHHPKGRAKEELFRKKFSYLVKQK